MEQRFQASLHHEDAGACQVALKVYEFSSDNLRIEDNLFNAIIAKYDLNFLLLSLII